MNPQLFLLSTNYIIDGTNGAGSANAATAPAGGGGIGNLFATNPLLTTLGYLAVIIAFTYILSIKPQKKREAEIEKMRQGLKIGDPIMLTTGIFGKIVDITAECFVVEIGLNKGVQVPVLKEQVVMVREPNLTNKVVEPIVEEEEKKGFFQKLFK